MFFSFCRRKIWSLAQTATTDSNQQPAALNAETTSPATNAAGDTTAAAFIDPTVVPEQQLALTANGGQPGKGHAASPLQTVSSYIGEHSSSLDTSVLNANNQLNQLNGGGHLTGYNGTLHHHQNYPPIDCGLAHNSNTFLGKVFFDYISTGNAGPLEHERNWTRIGLL